MSLVTRPISVLLIVSVLFAGGVVTCSGATLFDPALRFRRLPTEHFIIYFHQGEDRLARRLATIAEETWQALRMPLGITPPRLTHVVLADQTEVANGYATPLPYNTIVLYAVTPSGSEFNFDDWLRLSFTHEFTHIVHLDRSEGWARPVRWVFGRTAFAFPNLFLPTWQIEGIATYEESAITGEGRLHAGDFRAIVSEAARSHALEPLDRVNGGLTDWPSGSTVYAYGVGFHQYLADRFGALSLGTLANATAKTLPYLGSRAFKTVYGESLGSLWKDYETSLTTASGPSVPESDLKRLTHRGFAVTAPRFDLYGGGVLYSEVNPNGFPSLNRVGLDGLNTQQVSERYLGSTVTAGADEVIFDQMELRRDVGLYADLYAWSRRRGTVQRLSHNARLQDPDLSPDGQLLVCVQNASTGRRNLVLVQAMSRTSDRVVVTQLAADPGVQFNAPRWSPDGRAIVTERQRLGQPPEIVVVDVATKAVRVLASAPNARFATPTWRPDGAAIVAARAPGDETFNLVEIDVHDSTMRQLTFSTGGATWPDVSPDGKTIVFVGYTIEGYDVFTMPYPTSPPLLSPPTAVGISPSTPDDETGGSAPESVGYSPWPTLLPTSWSPVIEDVTDQIRLGVSAGGSDVLGYHSFVATATWLVSAPAGATTPAAATPDWQVAYAYARWKPTLYVAASDATSFYAGAASQQGTPADVTRRTLQIEGGLLLPFRHVRIQQSALVSIARASDDDMLPGGESTSRARTPVRVAWQLNTARAYGYSVSKEDGMTAGLTSEFVRQSLGSFADATTVTADARGYLPGFAPSHVVAVRIGAGMSSGDSAAGRTFLLGGDYPGASAADFDSRAFSLMRGFPDDTFAGSRIGLLNAEYRFPIDRPQRGLGTWPIFLHTIHAAVFADAGEAWTGAFRADALATSAGAELSFDIIAGYSLPLTLTSGAAWGHVNSGAPTDRVTVYFRVGKSF